MTAFLFCSSTASEAFASGGPRVCSGSHLSMSHFYVRGIFKKDFGALKANRFGHDVFRVSPRSRLRIQNFLVRELGGPWHYDGESLLVYKGERFHSVVVMAISPTGQKSILLFTLPGHERHEMQPLLTELQQLTGHVPVEVTLRNQFQKY